MENGAKMLKGTNFGARYTEAILGHHRAFDGKSGYPEGLDIEVRGFQGAGDSVVAGICIAVEKGLDGMEQLRSGVAAAHGSLVLEGTHLCTRENYDEMLSKVPVRKI